jgi:pterin-4a-carbinolamine dehydratase
MYSLVVYVPKTHKEELKAALFAAGAGHIGNYDSCCFELEGMGQFRALEGANPSLGKLNTIEQVEEVRLELAVKSDRIGQVVRALHAHHPYETPAFHVLSCASGPNGVFPLGREECANHLKQLHSEWKLSSDSRRLSRSYSFQDFQKAFDMASAISVLAQEQWHHPVLTVSWGSLNVEIWTHTIDGLVEADFEFAAKVEVLYENIHQG